jgi:hypothetical protein
MVVAVVILALAVAAGAAYWIVKRRQGPAQKRAPKDATLANRFGSVEIRVRNGACEKARKLQGRRFLAKDAPALPLPGCPAPQCSCKFAKLADRRTDSRRVEQGGLSASLFVAGSNRRTKRDRRRARGRD